MQIILSILLYLGVITSPNTYYMSEIRDDVSKNQSAVNSIQSDVVLLNDVVSKYKDKSLNIIILDDGQLK